MIHLSDHALGVILPVRAQAGARANGIRGEQGGSLKVAVIQVAEKGKANQALVDVLASGLGLKRSQVELVGGDTQRQKRFLIRNITSQELAERIKAALAQGRG